MVQIEPTVTSDSCWPTLQAQTEAFLEKVRLGEDLAAYLSLQPHSRGYSSAAAKREAGADRWADKDFLLNVMGYHHFHLGANLTAGGFRERTNDLLFAKVSRDMFVALGIFDHSVFEISSSTGMTDERNRLWRMYEQHSARSLAPGLVYAPALISTSGHPIHLVRLAASYARIVHDLDPKVDDLAYVRNLYISAGLDVPKKPKLGWHLNFQDLGLLDKASGVFFVFAYGPN